MITDIHMHTFITIRRLNYHNCCVINQNDNLIFVTDVNCIVISERQIFVYVNQIL